MKRTIAAVMSGAVLAGVLSVSIAQAKPISTSLIGGKGLRNAASEDATSITSKVSLKGQRINQRKANFNGLVTAVGGDIDLDTLIHCRDERSVVLMKWTQIAGAGTKKERDDKYAWKDVKGAHAATNEQGAYSMKDVAAARGSYKARVTRDSFSDVYGGLFVCKPDESDKVTV